MALEFRRQLVRTGVPQANDTVRIATDQARAVGTEVEAKRNASEAAEPDDFAAVGTVPDDYALASAEAISVLSALMATA